MSVHIDGLKARLQAADVTTYDTDVPKLPDFPYAVITAPMLHTETLTLDDSVKDVHDFVKVTYTGLNIESARTVAEISIAALDGAQYTIDGFHVWLKRLPGQPFQVDRDVKLDNGSHPIYAVDTYRYRATPA